MLSNALQGSNEICYGDYKFTGNICKNATRGRGAFCRRAVASPVVHFMLQTNRKSVQKKLKSTVKFYASFH